MERKRPSTTEKNSKKIKLTQPTTSPQRPICKYGEECYRKHPDHLRAYRHPSPIKKDEEPEEKPISSTSTTPKKEVSPNATTSLMELAELTGGKLLSQVYQMDFSSDLFDFWHFVSTIDEKNPRDALKNSLNLELVGPFDVLDGALKTCKTLPNMHLHYRYFYDSPEFMTIVRTLEKKSQFHIGYYRDSPDELPAFVASNDSSANNRFKVCGDNLFAAIHSHARHVLKSNEKNDFLKALETYAKKHGYSLDETTPKITARKKKINCTLLNSLGMVVPVENDIGYRPVQMTKDEFKKTCDKFCQSTSESARQTADDDLQHVITCIQFANDECDYGEGLEFGLNLFLYGSAKFHSRILNLLPLAYQLLHRNLFGQILSDHLASGRSNLIEEINEIEKNK